MSFHAVIPAGGAGTRLWPVSRQSNPKFLHDLTGSGRTLLQQTWDRLEPVVGAGNIHVVTGAAHAAGIREQLPALQHLVVEPSPHDSMPAIGLAAAIIEATDPGAVIGSFAADHVVTDDAAFAATLREAVAVAESGLVCTIGITPTEPSTAFGYIESGDPLGLADAPHAQAVRRFVEKPDAATAQEYVASGSYRWNAGMFVVSAEVLLGHTAALHPDLYEGLTAIAHAVVHGGGAGEVPAELWEALPKIAIDHAIAEPVAEQGGVATVPGEFGWVDIGDFDALAELGAERFAADPSVLWVDADGIALTTPGKTVTVVGIPDAVVIDTGDALLVTTREHAQRVKQLPPAWRERGRPDLS